MHKSAQKNSSTFSDNHDRWWIVFFKCVHFLNCLLRYVPYFIKRWNVVKCSGSIGKCFTMYTWHMIFLSFFFQFETWYNYLLQESTFHDSVVTLSHSTEKYYNSPNFHNISNSHQFFKNCAITFTSLPLLSYEEKETKLTICQGQYLFALNNINLLRLYNSTCSP